MIGDFFDFLGDSIFGFLNGLIGIFPEMPVDTEQIENLASTQIVGNVLGWVNWFLPLDVAAVIFGLWSAAMLTYLGIKMAMRYTGEIL